MGERYQSREYMKLKKLFNKMNKDFNALRVAYLDLYYKNENKKKYPLLKDYSTFLDDLEKGEYKDSALYTFILENVERDGKGNFMDSDAFYFLNKSIKNRKQKEIKEYKEKIKDLEGDIKKGILIIQRYSIIIGKYYDIGKQIKCKELFLKVFAENIGKKYKYLLSGILKEFEEKRNDLIFNNDYDNYLDITCEICDFNKNCKIEKKDCAKLLNQKIKFLKIDNEDLKNILKCFDDYTPNFKKPDEFKDYWCFEHDIPKILRFNEGKPYWECPKTIHTKGSCINSC